MMETKNSFMLASFGKCPVESITIFCIISYEPNVKGSLVDMILFTNISWKHAKFLLVKVLMRDLILFHLCPCCIRRSQALSTPTYGQQKSYGQKLWVYICLLESAPHHSLELRLEEMLSLWPSSAPSTTSFTGSTIAGCDGPMFFFEAVSQSESTSSLSSPRMCSISRQRQNYPLPQYAQHHNCTVTCILEALLLQHHQLHRIL